MWSQGQESGMRVQRTAPDTASGRTHPREDQASQHEVRDARAGSAAPRRAPGGRGAASATRAAPAATGQEDTTSRKEIARRRLTAGTVGRGASTMGEEPSTASPGAHRWREPVEECASARGAGCGAAPVEEAERLSQKHKLNEKLTKRRLRISAKWAKDGQQQEMEGAGLGPEQTPESDNSQRSRRSRRGAVLEPADSPEPDIRERSRRPRDTRSQSRSHSARRSPLR